MTGELHRSSWAVEPAVAASGISKMYGTLVALHPTDLVVTPCEQIAIMGPSGCGKTTLLNLIGGLDRPTSGSIRLRGKPMSYEDAELTAVHRYQVGFIFQGFALIPSLTVWENVEFTLVAGRVDREIRERRCHELLRAVDLLHLADRFPEELSGGQRQRVAIARSLSHAPGLVLADEPTGNLDHETGAAVMTLLTETCRELNSALIVVTHDSDVANRLERLVLMRDGRIQDRPGVSAVTRDELGAGLPS